MLTKDAVTFFTGKHTGFTSVTLRQNFSVQHDCE